jgi:hypothetical protein
MDDAADLLERSEVISKPIVVKAESKKRLSIEELFDRWPVDEVVDVQNPDRRTDDKGPSYVRMAITELRAAFAEQDTTKRLNALDLRCDIPNVIPRCLESDVMRFLLDVKAEATPQKAAHRPVERPGGKRYEDFLLLGMSLALTLTHHDFLGFGTWVQPLCGKKLWLWCEMSESEREQFGRQGGSFTGGKWCCVLLEPGDILIMLPGTAHAVITLEHSICCGGHMWSPKWMTRVMEIANFQRRYPDTTNEDWSDESENLIDAAARLVQRGPPEKFGGTSQTRAFSGLYTVGGPAPLLRRVLICLRNFSLLNTHPVVASLIVAATDACVVRRAGSVRSSAMMEITNAKTITAGGGKAIPRLA